MARTYLGSWSSPAGAGGRFTPPRRRPGTGRFADRVLSSWFPRTRAGSRNGNDVSGIGLIEVLIAITVLAGVAFATTYLLMSETSAVAGQSARLTGSSVATEVDNCLHASATSSLLPAAVVGGSTAVYGGPQTVATSTITTACPSAPVSSGASTSPGSYNVNATASLVAYKNGKPLITSANPSAWQNECFGFPGSSLALLQVQSTVQNGLAANHAAVGSGAMTTNQSSLIVPAQIDVKTETGNAPDTSVPVTISPSPSSLASPPKTGSTGCVSFVNLPPGTYTVTAGNGATSASVTLSAGQVYSLILQVPSTATSTQSAHGAPHLDSLQAIPWMASAWTPGQTPIPEGPATGGNTLVICGTGLFGQSGSSVTWEPTSVVFSSGGTTADASFTPIPSGSGCTGAESGDQQLDVSAPAFPSGTTVSITVNVVEANGTTLSGSLNSAYLYYGNPFIESIGTTAPCAANATGYCNTGHPSGTPNGGTPIDILGFNFDQLQSPGSAVVFSIYPEGAGSATSPMLTADANFSVVSSSQISAASPVDDVGITALENCVKNPSLSCLNNEIAYLNGSLTNYAAVQLVPGNTSAYSPSLVGSPDCSSETPVSLTWQGTGNFPVTCHFEYGPTPQLSSISPSSGPVGGGTTVYICGSPLGTVTGVDFGSTKGQFKINWQGFSVSGGACGDTLFGYHYIEAVTPPGSGAVQVTASNNFGTSNALTYSYGYPPVITGVSPTGGPVGGGNTVTISGSHLDHVTSVNFGCASVSSFQSQSSSQIVLSAPAASYIDLVGTCTSVLDGPEQVSVTAVNSFGTSTFYPYTYANTPSISSLKPANGPHGGGNTITICGSNFQYITSADFGGSTTGNVSYHTSRVGQANPCGNLVSYPSYLTVVVPSSPNGGYDQVAVTITNAAGMTSNSQTYTYNPPPPTISSVSQHGGGEGGGYSITISGSWLYGPGFNTSVNFGCPGNASINWGNNYGTVNVTVPNTASWTGMCGNYFGHTHQFQTTITVSTIGGSTSFSPWTYQNGASTSGLSPSSGNANGGNQVCVNGSNLQYATNVVFNDHYINVRYNGNNSQVCVTAPSNGGNSAQVGVWVQMPSGVGNSNSQTYTYQGPPSISSINPTSYGGCDTGSSTIQIYGSNFTGATKVTIGGNSVSYSVDNSGQITATDAWDQEYSGQVDVSTSIGTASGPNFSWNGEWWC